jgi:hypothetical protein
MRFPKIPRRHSEGWNINPVSSYARHCPILVGALSPARVDELHCASRTFPSVRVESDAVKRGRNFTRVVVMMEGVRTLTEIDNVGASSGYGRNLLDEAFTMKVTYAVVE